MCALHSPPKPRRPRWRKGLTWTVAMGLALFLTLGGFVYWVFHNRAFQDSFKERAIRKYLAQVQPHLPFRVEKLEIDGELKDLVKGELSLIRIVVSYEGYRATLEGPVHIKDLGSEGEVLVNYHPRIDVELPASNPLTQTKGRVPRFTVSAWTRLQLRPEMLWRFNEIDWVRELREIGFSVEEKNWKWPELGIATEGWEIFLAWADAFLLYEAQLGKTSYESANGERAFQWGGLKSEGRFPLVLSPRPELGTEFHLQGAFSGFELLWDEFYLDLPIKQKTWEARIQTSREWVISSRTIPPLLKTAVFKWPQVVSAEIDENLDLRLRTAMFPLADLAEKWAEISDLSFSVGKTSDKDLQFVSGDLQWEGSVSLKQERLMPLLGVLSGELSKSVAKTGVSRANAVKHSGFSSRIHIRDAMIVANSLQGYVKGLNANLPLSSTHPTQMSAEIKEIRVRRLTGKLAPLKLDFTPVQPSESGTGSDLLSYKIETQDKIPLEMKDMSLEIGRVTGELNLPLSQLSSQLFKLNTGIKIKELKAPRLAKNLCLPHRLIPPAVTDVDWTAVRVSPKSVLIEGQAVTHLFGGQVELRGMEIFDPLSTVPEIHFETQWGGIQLGQAGKFYKFGEVDGELVGYAKGVTFQGFLPTQYDFRVEAKPSNDDLVVFSPEAMKNFVRLVAGEDLEEVLPGIAHWVAFGWPSRLFGGYSVEFAGISLYSSNASILLRTLESKEVYAREGKHFILYGPRFKIPLQSTRYPVVLDAWAMTNFIRHVAGVIRYLQERGQSDQAKENSDEASSVETPESNTSDTCFPRISAHGPFLGRLRYG